MINIHQFCCSFVVCEQRKTFCSSNIKLLMCNSLLYLVFLIPNPQHTHTAHPDTTAGIRTQRSGFNRHEQNVYFLPILVVDSGPPSLSSTGTLTIHVCGCDTGESYCRNCTITNIIITVTFCISSSSTKRSSTCHYFGQQTVLISLCLQKTK